MAFTEHKITDFAHRLSDLPDQPNLSAAELKAYFDSSPEELRQAHNALCTDAARLDDRVSGIVAETFGDSIPKSMLSTELQSEIDAKAEERDLLAETIAREALETQVQTMETQKCEVVFGSYIGDDAASRTINLGFTPKAILLLHEGTTLSSANGSQYGGIAGANHPIQRQYSNTTYDLLRIVENGFAIGFYRSGSTYYVGSNKADFQYYFLALR